MTAAELVSCCCAGGEDEGFSYSWNPSDEVSGVEAGEIAQLPVTGNGGEEEEEDSPGEDGIDGAADVGVSFWSVLCHVHACA